MILDDNYTPPPVRVLYSQETGWSPDAPAELRRRPLVVPDAPEAPKQRTPWPTPAVTPREVPEKRGRPPKKASKPRVDRGTVSTGVAEILALRASGKKLNEIAAALGLSRQGVSKRLRVHRKASRQVAGEIAAGWECGCGGRKYPSSVKCWRCAKPELDKKRRAKP